MAAGRQITDHVRGEIELSHRKADLDTLNIDGAGSITKDMYDRTHGQLIQRRQEIHEMLERHDAGDEQFRIAVTTLVTLASKAAELFDRSQTDEKRQLIGYLFANLQMEGRKVRYSLKKPFNLLQDLADYKEWLPGPDSNQRPSD